MRRLPELLVLGVIALVTGFATGFGGSHDQYIPQVTSGSCSVCAAGGLSCSRGFSMCAINRPLKLSTQVMSYNSVSGTYETVGNSPDYMYPITIDGKKCYPTTLQLCWDGKIQPEDDKCCDYMMNDKDAVVYDTVPF